MASLISATASPATASAFTGVGVQLPRFGFVGSGGAPPRHGKMAGVMASKGDLLAVVGGAAAARFGIVGAGGSERRPRASCRPRVAGWLWWWPPRPLRRERATTTTTRSCRSPTAR